MSLAKFGTFLDLGLLLGAVLCGVSNEPGYAVAFIALYMIGDAADKIKKA